MKTKNRYLKYVAVVLVGVFLTAAAFLLLTLWERQQGRFTDPDTEDAFVTYEGRKYQRKEKIETFLVMGVDRYEDQYVSDSHGAGVQADFLMLLVLDKNTMQSRAVHINRDAMTKVNKLAIGGTTVVDSEIRQIALAYSYVSDHNDKIRCRNTVDSVEYLLDGAKVDHYIAMTMDSVGVGCDLVGGVEVTVLDDFTDVDDTLVKGQQVTLKGDQALRYVRTRYGLDDSSNKARMARQQQYITAFYKKALSKMEGDEEFALRFVDTMDDYVVYDLADQRLQQFMENLDQYEFQGIQELEGESEQGQEYMEFHADEEAARKLVIELFYEPVPEEG